MKSISRRLAFIVLMAAASLAGAGRSRADLVVSATISSNGGPSILGSLNLTTGQFTEVAQLSSYVSALTAGPGGGLVAALGDGHLYNLGSDGSLSVLGSGTATVPTFGTQYGYYGLAYSDATGFFGLNLNLTTAGGGIGIDRISADGNTVTSLTDFGDYDPVIRASGGLSFGPDGGLYLNGRHNSNMPFLFRVDQTTGATDVVGLGSSGLGTYLNHDLAFVNAGGQLYGVDSFLPAGPSSLLYVYTVTTADLPDPLSGAATNTGVLVTGVRAGYTIDALALPSVAAVPEPASLAMLGLGGVTLIGALRRKAENA